MSENSAIPNNGSELKKESLPLSKQFVKDFKHIFSNIIDECLSAISINCFNFKDHLKKMSVYYTFEKEPLLGELVVYAYEILEDPENVNDEKRHQIYVLACIFELGWSLFIFLDDIEDDAKLRCRKPCWHLLPDVGLLAMNDASLLHTFTYKILQQNFSEHLCYKLFDIINETFFISCLGQRMDVTLAKSRIYDDYTMKNYEEMNKLKVSFYSIESPIIIAHILSNKDSEESRQQIHSVCGKIGSIFQMQNDMKDFNKSDEKSSTDIQTAKCSWLAVTALERCSKEQRQIFEKCYGSWNPKDVQKIKQLYEELQLPQYFIKFRQTYFEELLRKIDELPINAIPDKTFYHKILNAVKKIKI